MGCGGELTDTIRIITPSQPPLQRASPIKGKTPEFSHWLPDFCNTTCPLSLIRQGVSTHFPNEFVWILLLIIHDSDELCCKGQGPSCLLKKGRKWLSKELCAPALSSCRYRLDPHSGRDSWGNSSSRIFPTLWSGSSLYPGVHKPGEGPKHLGGWGIPWVVCSGDSPPTLYMTFLNVLPLKTQPSSTSDGSQSQQGEHCTPPCGTPASLPPLLWPSCLCGKGANTAVLSEGNPLGNSPEGPPAWAGSRAAGSRAAPGVQATVREH